MAAERIETPAKTLLTITSPRPTLPYWTQRARKLLVFNEIPQLDPLNRSTFKAVSTIFSCFGPSRLLKTLKYMGYTPEWSSNPPDLKVIHPQTGKDCLKKIDKFGQIREDFLASHNLTSLITIVTRHADKALRPTYPVHQSSAGYYPDPIWKGESAAAVILISDPQTHEVMATAKLNPLVKAGTTYQKTINEAKKSKHLLLHHLRGRKEVVLPNRQSKTDALAKEVQDILQNNDLDYTVLSTYPDHMLRADL